MPNWCSTTITISDGDNIEKTKVLYHNIRKWISYNAVENGFGTNWLGNVILNSGIGTVDAGKETDIRCRGWINYLTLSDDNEIIIETETAWCPMVKVWLKLLEKYLPDASFVYYAEEPGMLIKCTNDPAETDKTWDFIEANELD